MWKSPVKRIEIQNKVKKFSSGFFLLVPVFFIHTGNRKNLKKPGKVKKVVKNEKSSDNVRW